MSALPKYIVITPARNEAEFIELTVKSMIAQTVPPLRWIVISDGSTDSTDEIVKRYAAINPWIELVRMPERQERHFAGKVLAFNSGLAGVEGLPYDVIVNLDADTSFDDEYFSFLLQKLAEDSSLGIIGGRLADRSVDKAYGSAISDPEYVSGPCQVFRRACFEDIGGYKPMRSGGVDLVAVLSARAKGWKTRCFAEKTCIHHRPMNGAQMRGFRERLHRGRMDYLLGSHPLWEVCRAIYQMKYPPRFLGGILILAEYFWLALLRTERTMPQELIVFRRKDQMRKLRKAIGHVLRVKNNPDRTRQPSAAA